MSHRTLQARLLPLTLTALFLPVAHAGGLAGPAVSAPQALNIRADRNADDLRLRAAPDGRVYAAWLEDTRAPGEEFGRGVFVKVLSGRTWTPMGGNLNYIRERSSSDLDLTVDEHGNPALAWSENFAHADMNNFRAWQDGRWTDWNERRIGQDLTYAARSRSLAVRDGAPHLAWGDILRAGTGTVLRLKSWRGSGWVNSPDFSRDPKAYAFAPSLAVTRSGEFVVAWLEGNVATSEVRVARLRGERWEPVGSVLNIRPNTYTFGPVLRLDEHERPLVAWIEDSGGTDTVYVSRWNGERWERLGGGLNDQPDAPAGRVAIATGWNGEIAVAWSEGHDGSRRVHARRWQGTRWEPVGPGPIAIRDAASPAIAVDRMGWIHVGFSEQRETARQVFVQRFAP